MVVVSLTQLQLAQLYVPFVLIASVKTLEAAMARVGSAGKVNIGLDT